MTKKILTIDSGNTRIKWALFNPEGDILESGAYLNAEIEKNKLPDATHVVISNVAGELLKKQIKDILPKGIASHWICSKNNECHVYNRYSEPEKLGTDRWAALIAAWHMKLAPCIVVNAGTALTIDALTINGEQGEFIGGMILPGIDLMQQSLGAATAQLPNITPSENALSSVTDKHHDVYAKNTIDAIRAGAINAACGAVLQIYKKLSVDSQKPVHILISGGNAQLIKDNLLGDVTNQALIVDNLVLRGLFLIENFAHKKYTKSEK